jgi:hypothetical protein
VAETCKGKHLLTHVMLVTLGGLLLLKYVTSLVSNRVPDYRWGSKFKDRQSDDVLPIRVMTHLRRR